MNILIISPSLRDGRASHRVALFWESYLREQGHTPTMLDLKEKDYPLFHERVKYMTPPSLAAQEVSTLVQNADGIIMVVPEYNGGYPASLKNIIDLL